MYNLSNLEPKFKAYLNSVNISSISSRNYLSDLRHFFGWLSLNSKNNGNVISTDLINKYKETHINDNLPMSTINRRLSAIRKFFSYCTTEGLIKINPALSIKNVALTKPVGKIENFTPLEKPLKQKTNMKKIPYVALLIILLTLIFIFSITSKINLSNLLLLTSAKDSKARYITFKGKVTDSLGNQLEGKTDIIFRLYNREQNGETLYTAYCTGSKYAITPDVKGFINISIGSDCGGNGIPNSIFVDNPEIYLGITIKNDQEMTPREKIANVGYALNSETVQGFPVGNSVSSVPIIDSTGNLLITAKSPSIKSTSGIFTINGQSITISTSGQNGSDINLFPVGNTIVQSGNLGVGTLSPSAKLDIEGSASISGNLVFRNIATQINQLNGGGIIFQTSIDADSQLIPRLTMTNAGNIGIGTLFPNTKLDVSGGARLYDSSPLIGSTTLTIRAGQGQGTSSLIQWQNSSGNSLGIIDAAGKLGIGTTNVQWKFQATDNQPNGSVAMIENTAVNNTSGHTGLQIKLGSYSNLNPNDSDRFVSFLRGDTTLLGKIQGNGSGGITYSTSGSDFAEYFDKNVNAVLDEGSVVSLDQNTGRVDINIKNYNPQTLGVVSNHPGFIGGNFGNDKILVALIGQVPVKISSRSQTIKIGDFITGSEDAGYAVKADRAGVVLGKSLENWDANSPSKTIQAIINVTWYDPGINLTSNGDLISLNKEIIYNGNLQNKQDSGFISGLTSKILDLTSNIISVREKITSPVIETGNIIATGEAKLNTIAVNEIRPQNRDLTINLNNQNNDNKENKGPLASIIIKGLENKTAATIDSSGNASFSGTLTAHDATISGKLIAKEIEAENINSLSKQIDTNKTDLNDVQKLLADIKNQSLPDEKNKLLSDLTVTGTSNFYNLAVINSGTIGNILLSNNSLLSLSWELKLSSLSTINFFDGAVVISKDGNITTNGRIIAEGGIKTSSIESTKIATDNIIINNKYLQATSSSVLISAADNFSKNGIFASALETGSESAGIGLIPENNNEVIIYNGIINNNSLIYLTPTSPSPPGNMTVSQKYGCSSENCKPFFKVTLDKPAVTPVQFNWLIIN